MFTLTLVQAVTSTSAARENAGRVIQKGNQYERVVWLSPVEQQAHHRSDRPPLLPRSTSSDIKMTFSPARSASGQSEGTMITATIQPSQTKLSLSGECQHKFADVQTLLFPLCLSPLFLIHLHNPCDTPINNSCVICISMPEIEDRHSHSKYSPARNKQSNVVFVLTRDLQGEG